jgi:hypothetical protein
VLLGLTYRATKSARSKEIDLQARLFVPCWLTEKLLPSQNSWQIKFYCQSPEFCTLTQPKTIGATVPKYEVKVLIHKCELNLSRVQLSEKALDIVRNDIETNKKLTYPFLDYNMQSFTINDGSVFMNTPTTTLSKWPRRVYCWMVRESAVNGNFLLNPLNFEHFNLENISLSLNGKNYTLENLDFKNSKVIDSYYNMTKALGISNRNFSLDIENYVTCNTFFVWDVTKSGSSASCADINVPQTSCNYSLKLKFGEKLDIKDNIILYVCCEVDSMMVIGENGVTI